MKSKNFFNIVLFEPEIPQNTGNIARMCVANDLHLHLIEPLGFKLEDKYLKRSAMDYWSYLKLTVHPSWHDFLLSETFLVEDNLKLNSEKHFINSRDESLFFFTSYGTKSYWDIKYKTSDYLIFGSESRGYSAEIFEKFKEQMYLVPMSSANARCLNLASTAQTVYYEAFRQSLILGV